MPNFQGRVSWNSPQCLSISNLANNVLVNVILRLERDCKRLYSPMCEKRHWVVYRHMGVSKLSTVPFRVPSKEIISLSRGGGWQLSKDRSTSPILSRGDGRSKIWMESDCQHLAGPLCETRNVHVEFCSGREVWQCSVMFSPNPFNERISVPPWSWNGATRFSQCLSCLNMKHVFPWLSTHGV